MCEVKAVKSKYIFKIGKELLSQGKTIKLTVTGDSMYPFLRHNLDFVELISTNFSSLSKGDIVLILRANGEYILHRIIKKTKFCIYITGDSQQWIEGPIYPHQIIAAVSAIYRESKRIPCSNILLKILCNLWLLLFPLRRFIIHSYSQLRKFF